MTVFVFSLFSILSYPSFLHAITVLALCLFKREAPTMLRASATAAHAMLPSWLRDAETAALQRREHLPLLPP